MATGLGRGLSSLIPPKKSEVPPSSQPGRPVTPGSPAGAKVGFPSAAPSSVIPTKMPASRVEVHTPVQSIAEKPEISRPSYGSSLQVVDLPISEIDANPTQPRQHFDEQALEDLSESIRRYGILEPIIVTQEGERWQIVAGERRYRASKKIGKKTIPAIIRSASELERLELALIENIQRQDLNPIEKAESLARLIDEFGLTQEEAAKKMGMARSSLANLIRLLDLPQEIRGGLASGRISEGHGKVLLGLTSDEERLALYQRMTSGSAMSVKELSEVVNEKSTLQKPGQESMHTLRDHELKQAEDQLQASLGTKVKISRSGKGGRKITIETHSSEDFSRIFKQLIQRG